MLINHNIKLNDKIQFSINLSFDTLKIQFVNQKKTDLLNTIKATNNKIKLWHSDNVIAITDNTTDKYIIKNSIGRFMNNNTILFFGLNQYQNSVIQYKLIYNLIKKYNAYNIKQIDTAIDLIGLDRNRFTIPIRTTENHTYTKPSVLLNNGYIGAINGPGTLTYYIPIEYKSIINQIKKTIPQSQIKYTNDREATLFKKFVVVEKIDIEKEIKKHILLRKKQKKITHIQIKSDQQIQILNIDKIIKKANIELDYSPEYYELNNKIYVKSSKKSITKLYDKWDRFINDKVDLKRSKEILEQLIINKNIEKTKLHRIEFVRHITKDNLDFSDKKLIDRIYRQISNTKIRFFNISQRNQSQIYNYIKTKGNKAPMELWNLEPNKNDFIDFNIQKEDIELMINEFIEKLKFAHLWNLIF